MIVTNGQLATTLKNVQRKHLNDFRSRDIGQGYRQIATVIPSNTETEELSWFGEVPAMADVTNDEVTSGGAEDYDHSLKNRVYQTMVEFKREWWEDDKLGHGNVLVQRLTNRTMFNRAKHALTLFESTDTSLVFDGAAFFGDSRTQGSSGTIDNNIGVNVTDTSSPTSAEVSDIVDDATVAMLGYKDDKGEQLFMTPDLFIVPSQLYGPMYRGLSQGRSGSGTTEPIPPIPTTGIVQAGPYKLMVNPFLTSSTVIYAMHTMAEVKPIVMIERMQPQVGGITDVNSDWWLIKRRIPYVAYDRFRFGWGDPRTAIKITLT